GPPKSIPSMPPGDPNPSTSGPIALYTLRWQAIAGAAMRHPPRQGPPRTRGSAPSHGAPLDHGDGVIFGIHAVEAALLTPGRSIAKLFLTDNAERRLQQALSLRHLAHERVLPKDLDRRLGPDTVHQGALIEVEPLPEPPLKDLVQAGARRPIV